MLLNSASRQFILNTALESAFGKRKLALDVEYDRIAKAIYDALFTKTQQEHINALPKCFYTTGTSHRFNMGGERHDWAFNGDGSTGGPVTNTLRLPADTWTGIGTLTMDKHRALIARGSGHDYQHDKKTLAAERDKAEKTLMALLKGVRTLEQLKDVWPEGHKFYKGAKAAVPTPPGLPAIAMADLNKMLGIAA
jgi:hypothetical protein